MTTLSTLEIYALARQAGFSQNDEEAVIATAIALAESSGNPGAHNDNQQTGDDSFGLWQINMIGDLGPERRRQFGIASNDQLLDPPTNARAARSVFTAANASFTPWSTFKRKDHEVHLPAARDAAQQVETSGLAADVFQEDDLTEAELRKVVSEELTGVLNHEATKVFGIISWGRYLEVLLEAARKN
jgi:Lysozyme like domain